MTSPDTDATAIASYLFEIGTLKRAKRTGWWIAGVKDPESIAEHSFRTAILASLLAEMEGADSAKAAQYGIFHDTQETRVTDISRIGKRYLTAASNESVTAEQIAQFPSAIAARIQDLVDSYERQDTTEAIIARDADKLECLLQAIEYLRQGHLNAQRWIDSSLAALKTESALRIANAAVGMTGLEWAED